jgi:hypothetical protein
MELPSIKTSRLSLLEISINKLSLMCDSEGE